jgi:hypothetical protein
MWTRLTLFVLGLFWAGMLGLLCWSEFGGKRHLGTGASVDTIWNKILTCPDSSAMSVKIDGEDIGYFHWKPEILEGGVKSTGSEDTENLEGMIQQIQGYEIEVITSFGFAETGDRIRIGSSVLFNPDKNWQSLSVELRQNDESLNVRTSATDRQLKWTANDQTYELSYEQLKDPSKLMGRFGGPLAAMALSNVPFLARGGNAANLAASIKWEASFSWIRILNQRVRCYELHTRVFDRDIRVFVSLVGEILRVELPNGIELVNTTETQM